MTISQLYRSTLNKFKEAGIETPDFEARILLCELLSLTSADFFIRSEEDVSPDLTEKTEDCCKRRINGEPLQYIIGKWDFMGNTYAVGPGVLIPRPETELLCEQVIECLNSKGEAVVYDLCSGTGCIGITVKKAHPEADIFLVEKSPEAIGYLMKNTKKLLKNTFYTIVVGNVLDIELFELYPKADVIISNPPYIKSEEIPLLQKEVTFEPEMALDGGEDGLVFYRYIVSEWSKKLKPDGEFFFEIGEDQGSDVCKLLDNIGFNSKIIKDYNNHDRIVAGRKKPYDF